MKEKSSNSFKKSQNKKIQNLDVIKKSFYDIYSFIKIELIKPKRIINFIIWFVCTYFAIMGKWRISIVLYLVFLCFYILPDVYKITKCMPIIIKGYLYNNKIRMQRFSIDIIITIASILVLLTAILMKFNIFNIKNYNPDFGSLLGGAISGIATLLVIRHTITIDDRRAIYKARLSAGILSENISNVWDQVDRLELEANVKISYINNWLDYYRDILYVAKNEYLTALLKEFQFVDAINVYIEKGNKEKIRSILNERKIYIQNYTGNFNIIDAYSNISNIQFGNKEEEAWEHQSSNISMMSSIEKELYTIIEKRIYDILLKKGTCTFWDITDQLVKLVRSNEKFEKIYENRVIITALINICCRIDREGNRIKFCWNELSLK